jgi:23S rRNA pseudouridine1911/1915/1917 synthase
LAVSERKEAAGGRLDRFLCLRLHGYSRAMVQKMIGAGRVRREGKTLKASATVHENDVITVRYPRTLEEPARYTQLDVVYDDAHLLAINKPGDLLSHPTDKIRANAVTTVLQGQFPDTRLHLVHRLDRETSGVLLLAKDSTTARAMAEQFSNHEVRKEYIAVVHGQVDFTERVVDLPIGREGGVIKVRQAVGAKDAVPSVTEFHRLAHQESQSVVRALPRSGRLHQIRVHLAALGHPILGDKLYCGDGAEYLKAVAGTLAPADISRLGARRQLLHARTLRLTHPVGGASLVIHAPLPTDFENIQDIDIATQER